MPDKLTKIIGRVIRTVTYPYLIRSYQTRNTSLKHEHDEGFLVMHTGYNKKNMLDIMLDTLEYQK